ncbi:hypothetical protein [Halomonas cerina]|uniref:Uncharacterized protein n=1 Tax=Halomonas cerina TaxID=447424 RepID=A0A839VHB5_9GAMM|nr:hypothetical protein [Halomonas cerina]MBB3192077.1 hypothetical protein [Halomonas cerina]
MSQLTREHRVLISRIQDICIDITLHHPELVATCQYSGGTHELSVRLTPRAHLSKHQGGDDSFRGTELAHIYLPGTKARMTYRTATGELADLITNLESLLLPPGGAA